MLCPISTRVLVSPQFLTSPLLGTGHLATPESGPAALPDRLDRGSHRDASDSHVTAAGQQQRAAPHPHWQDPTDSPFAAPLRSPPPRGCIPMWRRGAHADAAHHLPTAGPGASSSSTAAASAGAAAARRRRRPGLPCRPSHLFFALLVALFTASLLVVWQLLPIGDGDAAEGDGEAPPRLQGGEAGPMRFSSSSLALRAFDGESRLEAARSGRRLWASLAPVRVALVSAPLPFSRQHL